MKLLGFDVPLTGKTAYQFYNGLIATVVIHQLVTEPTISLTEVLPDVLIHAAEALMPDALPSSMAFYANAARGIQAGYAFFTGSTIPSTANAVDVFNHALNMGYHA